MRDSLLAAPVMLLLFGGTLKGSPSFAALPIDLTLLSAFAVASTAGIELIKRRGRVPPGTGVVYVLLIVLTIPAIYLAPTAYAASKVSLLPLVLLCIAGPMVTLSNENRLWWLIKWLAIGAFAIALLAILDNQIQNADRLTAGGGTIGFARTTSVGLIATITLGVARRVPLTLIIVPAGVLGYATIASGSRGPTIGLLAAIMLIVLWRQGRHKVREAFLVLLVSISALWWAFQSVSETSQSRFLLLLDDERGASVDARSSMLHDSLGVMMRTPEGLGWGGLENIIYPFQYPHNVYIEVAAEAGWAAGILLIFVLLGAFFKVYKFRANSLACCLAAILLLYTINGLISGDISDNRGLFLFLGLALASSESLRVSDRLGLEHARSAL